MPRIKFPISQTEKDHNKRYEAQYQKNYITAINKSKIDKYAIDFLLSCEFNLTHGSLNLTERQADYLFSLYERYSI